MIHIHARLRSATCPRCRRRLRFGVPRAADRTFTATGDSEAAFEGALRDRRARWARPGRDRPGAVLRDRETALRGAVGGRAHRPPSVTSSRAGRGRCTPSRGDHRARARSRPRSTLFRASTAWPSCGRDARGARRHRCADGADDPAALQPSPRSRPIRSAPTRCSAPTRTSSTCSTWRRLAVPVSLGAGRHAFRRDVPGAGGLGCALASLGAAVQARTGAAARRAGRALSASGACRAGCVPER